MQRRGGGGGKQKQQAYQLLQVAGGDAAGAARFGGRIGRFLFDSDDFQDVGDAPAVGEDAHWQDEVVVDGVRRRRRRRPGDPAEGIERAVQTERGAEGGLALFDAELDGPVGGFTLAAGLAQAIGPIDSAQARIGEVIRRPAQGVARQYS